MADIDRVTLVQTGVSTSGRSQPSLARRWTCRVTAGASGSRQVPLSTSPMVFGAHAECHVILVDEAVSGRHLELQVEAGGVRVRDLGSKNGTFLQGNRVEGAVIACDAVLRVGSTSLNITCAALPTLTPSQRQSFGSLVGDSHAMREVFAVLELVAPTDATVLLQGESGTGKELAARAIHDHSTRANHPFVIVDCSATSESLIDSQLFGHRRGAFTGAVADRRGAFVEAHTGTLFLDEVGELPLASQGKLLRAIEGHTVQALGSDTLNEADARIVAATHRDLPAMVEKGTFRFDLFHRLAVVNVHLPPLRDRPSDLPCLVRAFYEGRDTPPGDIAGDNLETLQRHAWPGNVRELRNVLERAWVLCPESKAFSELKIWHSVEPLAQLPVEVDASIPLKEARQRWLETLEPRYLAAAFAAHGGNITRTSEAVGVARQHLRAMLAKYGITKP